MKKIFKILGIIVVVILAAIFIIPIVFEGRIIEMVKKTANNNINGTLDFEDADLSIWSGFPSAEVSLHNTSLVNKAPFEGDTLFQADQIDLKLPIAQLFKSGADISITTFTVDGANLAIKIRTTHLAVLQPEFIQLLSRATTAPARAKRSSGQSASTASLAIAVE